MRSVLLAVFSVACGGEGDIWYASPDFTKDVDEGESREEELEGEAKDKAEEGSEEKEERR